MKKKLSNLILTALLLSLAGCADPISSLTSATPSSASSSATPTPSSATSIPSSSSSPDSPLGLVGNKLRYNGSYDDFNFDP